MTATIELEPGGGGGVSDHGLLTGLLDDDHPQYAKTDGTRGAFAHPADVASEAATRAASDSALDSRLDTIEGDYATGTALTAETSTRAAADTALDSRLDALEAVDPLTETEADGLYRRQDVALVDGDIPAAIARDSELAAAIAALVAGAPSGLDTLDELAAAINDDPSFFATVAAAIAAKVSTAGHTAESVPVSISGSLIDLAIATSTVLGRKASGDVVALTMAELKTLLALAAGDISGLGSLATLSTVDSAHITDGTIAAVDVADNAISNAKAADMAANTVKANITGSTADPTDVTRANLITWLALVAANISDFDTQVAATAILKSLVDAKGDLLVGTADNTVARLAAGANDSMLLADSAQTGGMKWANAATIIAALGLRSGADGVNTLVNTATAGAIAWDLITNPSSLESIGFSNGRFTTARLATVAALPACTYNNGTSGVGATLTGNSNGQLADQDFTTPAANDRLLVQNQAAPEQDGLYIVTTLGTAGTPFVLTRWTPEDTSTEQVLAVWITAGQVWNNSFRLLRPGSGATMGTTAITTEAPNRIRVSGGDILHGPTRDGRIYASDMEELFTTITATGVIPGTPFLVTLGGTAAQIVQAGGAPEFRPGVADMQTGTTTTGFAAITAGTLAAAFSLTKRASFFAQVKTPTVSDGTQTYSLNCGFMDTVSTVPTAGIFFRRNSGANWICVTRHAGAETTTDSGIAADTTYRGLSWEYNEVRKEVKFFIGNTLVATHTDDGHLPSGDTMSPNCLILKSAGGTSRSLYLDRMTAEQQDGRAVIYVAR